MCNEFAKLFTGIAKYMGEQLKEDIKLRTWIQKEYMKCVAQRKLASMLKILKKRMIEVTLSIQTFGLNDVFSDNAHVLPVCLLYVRNARHYDTYSKVLEKRRIICEIPL